MKSKQLLFFILLEDIEKILKDIEGVVEVVYYKTGLHDDKDIPVSNSILDTPNVGFTLFGDWNRVDSYLVMKNKFSLIIRDVPQRTGEKKFAVDQLVNPHSIELKLGGIYKGKENIIIAGRISTVSESSDSTELFNIYSKRIKKEFKKIGSFYVGRKAEEKLRSGWRLVTNDKSPKEYDLALN